MALLTVKELGAGDFESDADFVAASASDTFYDTGDHRTFYLIKNGSGSSVTATVTRAYNTVKVASFGTLTVAARTKAIPAGATGVIGPFSQQYINSDGIVTVTLSSATTVTVAPVRIPSL
jgi:hypothetical protein